MPFERAEPNDPLTRMTELKTSPVMEMISGLQVLSHPWRRGPWKARAASALGESFMETLKIFSETYQLGPAFIELAIDCPDPQDVMGFIHWVETLDQRQLAFYLLGRVYPLETLPERINRESITKLMADTSLDLCFDCITTPLEWANNLEKMRKRAVALWTEYWERFFREDMETCRNLWDAGNRELEELLIRSGGTRVYKKFSESGELPPPIPADQPYTSVHYIPVCHTLTTHLKYFGYGNITVLYDCTRSTEEDRSREEAGKTALRIARAIGDERRLRILTLIARMEYGLNGKSIAEKMKLSPSVISRHLSQLKDAGLITEKSEDNRNITYRLNWQTIDELSPLLMYYLGNE
ncbi:MAG: winged helix-turn-helix transcriptional regulator [Spirochaetales bacterium]|nr:winged helix-turn-helix transcriptional regulator [Spirochaetales bacterium]